MAKLNFKGKEFVYNHHLAVPFRPLMPHEDKGIGPVAFDGNLVIHGDNLHALKSLSSLWGSCSGFPFLKVTPSKKYYRRSRSRFLG